jgi:hypothetical protein
MKHLHFLLVGIVFIASLQLSACTGQPDAAAADEQLPAQVEHLTGAQPARVTLTEDAARRLDLQTDVVQIENTSGVQETVIPYSSIIYDTEGGTWVYASSEPLTYLRTPVQVQTIRGDDVVITPGLTAGTAVVTVGAEELFGSETEFEEE